MDSPLLVDAARLEQEADIAKRVSASLRRFRTALDKGLHSTIRRMAKDGTLQLQWNETRNAARAALGDDAAPDAVELAALGVMLGYLANTAASVADEAATSLEAQANQRIGAAQAKRELAALPGS